MALDSDINNADSQLHVTFYENDVDPYKGVTFVRIITPGDKTVVREQAVNDDHKKRFPQKWLSYSMKDEDATPIGTPLADWNKAQPEEFNDFQMAELQIYKFQTVEQLALASDSQLQRIGMGGVGLRERARQFLAAKNRSADAIELDNTKQQLAVLQAQMQDLINKRNPVRIKTKEL